MDKWTGGSEDADDDLLSVVADEGDSMSDATPVSPVPPLLNKVGHLNRFYKTAAISITLVARSKSVIKPEVTILT